MEKQLSAVGYWLGLICIILALILRLLAFFNSNPFHIGPAGGSSMTYLSFLHGAAMFFLLSIASWCRTAKS